MNLSIDVNSLITGELATFSGVTQGYDAYITSQLATHERPLLFIARDDVAMEHFRSSLAFFAPDCDCLVFPAWDCLPYDRVSPKPELVSQRIAVLSKLSARVDTSVPLVVITTVAAVLQRVPAKSIFEKAVFNLTKNKSYDLSNLTSFMLSNGYHVQDTVMEPGEYSVRGGIVDIFPAASLCPYRLDFFGDELEKIRAFDAASQLTIKDIPDTETLLLRPVSEVLLDDETIARFRSNYRVLFQSSGDDDALFQAISAGQRHIGMEHWLPLFHEYMETLFDYLPDATILLDQQTDLAITARLELIDEYYTARHDMIAHQKTTKQAAHYGGQPYRPVPIEAMFLSIKDWQHQLTSRAVGCFQPFKQDDQPSVSGQVIHLDVRAGREFSDIRVHPDINVFDALGGHIQNLQKTGIKVIISAFSEGSCDRLSAMLGEHGLKNILVADNFDDVRSLDKNITAIGVTMMERGFETADLAVITEQDILGEKLIRSARKKIKAENFIAEASSLSQGDLIVHLEHGIARFDGLEQITVTGAPHDCLRLIYAGDDKLFLPVENIDMISRFGSELASANLDRLGGVSWQARKAGLKNRIREMAAELIKIAAARELKKTEKIFLPSGLYDEFSSRFQFVETDDQDRAIKDTLDDLSGGRPVDRLICGDVGFGKTEVALRAAFVAAMSGKQVAIVTPTTLLCRQHYLNFLQRFKGFPVKIAQLSRLVSAKDAAQTKQDMINSKVDIVIGTHALLSKDIGFSDLGLLIIDEEQHFGVAHKERLKNMKSDIHVITLTATPIPRTLQLAMSGVREMSLIATPPVDRLAVRTFIMPYDAVIIREAILRERFRGGQIFYVCPRLADLGPLEERLRELVPEAKLGVAHGRMSPAALEQAITDFYDAKFDILLSTNIVESGLDMPSVNTIIVHRADMFGLSQLYQLRGRVGRSKVRAYAYLTFPEGRSVTKNAMKRLEVMQTLDTLGAGFTLASHDLDIRGAGNLLGQEQSGHIREVGIELYQQMLEEAVAEARGDEQNLGATEWSPQISLGMAVMIPEHYVADLSVRMGLYRRIVDLQGDMQIEGFKAEMIDRFGPLPAEMDNLIKTVELKQLCRTAGISKIDSGPKGAVVAFHNDAFSNPAGLVGFIQQNSGTAKLRPDHRLVFMRTWDSAEERLAGVRFLTIQLVKIALEGQS